MGQTESLSCTSLCLIPWVGSPCLRVLSTSLQVGFSSLFSGISGLVPSSSSYFPWLQHLSPSLHSRSLVLSKAQAVFLFLQLHDSVVSFSLAWTVWLSTDTLSHFSFVSFSSFPWTSVWSHQTVVLFQACHVCSCPAPSSMTCFPFFMEVPIHSSRVSVNTTSCAASCGSACRWLFLLAHENFFLPSGRLWAFLDWDWCFFVELSITIAKYLG